MSTVEVIGIGDDITPKRKYVNSPTICDESDINSTKDSSKERDQTDEDHIDNDEFFDDITNVKETTLFFSKRYKTDGRL